MLYETHVKIGLNTWDILLEKQKKIVVKKSFINGNVLPDIHPSYRVRKHRLKQFEGKIHKKVTNLAALSYEDIGTVISHKKFSRELGIICHFISDFFCTPHSKWGVKESMNLKHVKYEKELQKKIYEFEQVTDVYKLKNINEYKNFFEKSLNSHFNNEVKSIDEENDIYYSMYVCNSIISYILNSIEKNSKGLGGSTIR